MKRVVMYIAMVFSVVLAMGTLAGCGQNASSGSSSAPSTSPAASKQSKDEVIAELKNITSKNPEIKSITVNEKTAWTYTNEETAKPETVQATGVYKFDMNGTEPKESITAEYADKKLQYFIDSKKDVLVIDGTAYSGTTEQFGTKDYIGFETFVKHVIGDFDTIAGCATSAEKADSSGPASYMLTLDPEKYMASDEALTALKELVFPVKDALLTIVFDEKGNVSMMSMIVGFEGSSIEETLEFSDFNSTVVDPAPEATKTYEEMEKSMQMEIQTLMKELDAYSSSVGKVSAAPTANEK